jgi:hypothetical protein
LREVLNKQWDLAIFHPDCTYLTISAEWAYKDADFARYPGVGYHQKLKAGTLAGEKRREARKEALAFFRLLLESGIPKIAVENPVGVVSTSIRPSDQTIQPWMFGDDASKATCLWLVGLDPLLPSKIVPPKAWQVVKFAADMPVCECCDLPDHQRRPLRYAARPGTEAGVGQPDARRTEQTRSFGESRRRAGQDISGNRGGDGNDMGLTPPHRRPATASGGRTGAG